MTLEIVTFIAGLILSALITHYYYKREREESRKEIGILREEIRKYSKILESLINAQIRLGGDKCGKIVKKEDGTYAIQWKITIHETLGLVDSVNIQESIM